MTPIGRFLLHVARWIAGRARAEWIDAMEAEAVSMEGSSTWWAVGCAAAALNDRLLRERWFLAAIIGLPIVDFGLRMLLFGPVVDAGNALGLPSWTFIAVFLFLAFPFGLAVGRYMQPGRAIVAALFCGLLLESAGVVEFWIVFGIGPQVWFQPNSHVYNMAPILGWATSISIWLIGAVVGSLTRPNAASAKSDQTRG